MKILLRQISFWVALLAFVVGGAACRSAARKTTEQPTPKVNVFPPPVGYVNDFAELLSDDEHAQLTQLLTAFSEKTTHQLVVATVADLAPYQAIEPYATDLFNAWGIGTKEKNNGVLLLIAVKERRVRIEVGRGLESVLPNDLCAQILRQQVTPFLRTERYGQACENGTRELMRILATAAR